MALLTLAALVGLAAISGTDATCYVEGSSAFRDTVVALTKGVTGGTVAGTATSPTDPTAVCTQTSAGVCYAGNGSGSGRNWIAKGSSLWLTSCTSAPCGPLAFSDNSYSGAQTNPYGSPNPLYKNGPKPANVAEFPIAIGAIAQYRDSRLTIPVNACLCKAALCTLYSSTTNRATLTWKSLGQQCGISTWPASPVKLVVRADSSGSTDALKAYLLQPTVCGATYSFVASAGQAGVLYGDRTSGLLQLLRSTPGSVGYAACGNGGTGLTEFAVQNQRNNCIKCSQCATATPSATAQCGIYNKFQIQVRACDWSGVQPNGDKDNDKDGVVDLDNDSDGVGLYDFPVVFLEYALMPTTVPAGQFTCCKLLKNMLKFLMNAKTQAQFASQGFYNLPSYVLAASCKCMAGRKCGDFYKGVYTAGACT